MTIDMNELHRRNPKEYHARLATAANGRLLQLKEELGDARDSVDRGRTEKRIEEARSEAAYHRRMIAELGEGNGE